MTGSLPHLLAQPDQAPRGGMEPIFLLGLIVFMFVFMIVLNRGNRKAEQRKRQELLSSLKKSDRVLTYAGIVGTVVQIKDHEVVLKVDESTNTKMTFVKEAIRQIINDPSDLTPTDKR